MRYLTYDEYINISGTLDETAFERTIDKACGIVDLYTQKRLRLCLKIPKSVKACIRDICEAYHQYGSNKNISSKSQSSGGVSESESYISSNSENLSNELKTLIYDYLTSETDDDGVPLLYKGASGIPENKRRLPFDIVEKTYIIQNESGELELTIPVVEVNHG